MGFFLLPEPGPARCRLIFTFAMSDFRYIDPVSAVIFHFNGFMSACSLFLKSSLRRIVFCWKMWRYIFFIFDGSLLLWVNHLFTELRFWLSSCVHQSLNVVFCCISTLLIPPSVRLQRLLEFFRAGGLDLCMVAANTRSWCLCWALPFLRSSNSLRIDRSSDWALTPSMPIVPGVFCLNSQG